MDYEKAYKEALERAKDYHKQLLDEDNPEWAGEIENIFPELKESEDDRISREITKFILTHRIDEPNDIEDTNSWLAWLEKQGEHKTFDYENANVQQKDFAPLEVDGFDAELNALLKKYEHLPKEELQEPLEFYLGVVRDDLDVVREEKPKWTGADDYNVQCCIAKIENDIANGRLGRNKELIEWLQSLKQRMEG